jgi:hypothetical protein
MPIVGPHDAIRLHQASGFGRYSRRVHDGAAARACRRALRLMRFFASAVRGPVTGCATPTGSGGHAGPTANLKLTFQLDHSSGADQLAFSRSRPQSRASQITTSELRGGTLSMSASVSRTSVGNASELNIGAVVLAMQFDRENLRRLFNWG